VTIDIDRRAWFGMTPYRAKTSSDRKRGKKDGKSTALAPKNSFQNGEIREVS